MIEKLGFLLIEEDAEYAGISKDVLIRINPNILLIIISEIEYENICYISQSYIAEQLGISQPNVSKNIKVLADHNLIFKENTKKGKALRVNCRIAWKGNKSSAFNIAFAKDSEHEIL